MRSVLSWIIAVLLAYAVPGSVAYSQQPACKFVSIETRGNRICVTYDLVGSVDTKYVVTLYIQRENDPGSLRKLEKVKGDVGDDRPAGMKLTIYWDKTEISDVVEGVRYQFALEVRQAEGGGLPWYLYAGAAVVGGAVYFAVRPESKSTPADTRTVPFPPPR